LADWLIGRLILCDYRPMSKPRILVVDDFGRARAEAE
jgi:hypothetical protein